MASDKLSKLTETFKGFLSKAKGASNDAANTVASKATEIYKSVSGKVVKARTATVETMSYKVVGNAPTSVDPLIRPPMPQDAPWKNISPLSGHPLSKELDVKGRLERIDQLIKKYHLATDPNCPLFQDARERISLRERESRLFLGVVGEFSSGKSTLINALIRDNLLRTDIEQGTTAAATLIYYGTKLSVEIRHRKKHFLLESAKSVFSTADTVSDLFRKPEPEPTREKLLDKIHQATSNEEVSKDVTQVNVELPSRALAGGLVIVDTPGTNVQNVRHAKVTAAAIRDLCDAVVIAVPADIPASESLIAFLKEYAGDVVHRCLFVMTKLDHIRVKKERDSALENLRSRLSQALNLSIPRVLTAAPQFVIESLKEPNQEGSEDGYTQEEILEWVSHFEEMEKKFHSLLLDKRLQAQADDVAKMMADLFQKLQDLLQSLFGQYRSRHEALEKLVIPDIDKFIGERVDKHVSGATDAMDRSCRQLEIDLESSYSWMTEKIREKISSVEKSADLEQVVKSKIPSILEKGHKRLQGHVESLFEGISIAGHKQLELFHKDFQNHFRSLATLGGSLSYDSGTLQGATRQFSNSTKGVSAEIAASLKQIDQNRAAKAVGGGAAGALFGTMLLPGIGTLAGGIAGALLSKLFGPSLEHLKNDCWEKLQTGLAAQMRELDYSIKKALAKEIKETIEQLSVSIREYRPRYEALVEQMRRRDADEKKELSNTQATINADIAQLKSQQNDLNAIRERIRNM